MFCNKCGKQLDEGTKFCPECGNKIETIISANQQAGDAPYNENVQENYNEQAVKETAKLEDIQFSEGYVNMEKELPVQAKKAAAKKKFSILIVVIIIVAVAALLLMGLFFGNSENGRIKKVKSALKGSWEVSYEASGMLVTDQLDFYLEDSEKAVSTAGAIYKNSKNDDGDIKVSEIEGIVVIEEDSEYSGTITIDNDEIGGTFGTIVLAYAYEPATNELKLYLKSYWPSKNIDEFSYNLQSAGKLQYEKMD